MVCTKHLSRLSGSAELGDPFSARDQLGGTSVLETRQFPPAVLLKSGAQPARVVPLSPGSGEGQTQAKHLVGIGMWSEPKPASNHACGIRVEGLSAVNGVKAPGEQGAPKSRLNPARSQLGVRLTGLAPSSR